MATQIASCILRLKLEDLKIAGKNATMQREIVSYIERLENLLAELEDAENDRGRDPVIEAWKIGLLGAIYLAEDNIDVFFSQNVIRRQNSITKRLPFSLWTAYRIRNQFSNDMNRVLKKIPSRNGSQSGKSGSSRSHQATKVIVLDPTMSLSNKQPMSSDEHPESPVKSSSQVENAIHSGHSEDPFDIPESWGSSHSKYAEDQPGVPKPFISPAFQEEALHNPGDGASFVIATTTETASTSASMELPDQNLGKVPDHFDGKYSVDEPEDSGRNLEEPILSKNKLLFLVSVVTAGPPDNTSQLRLVYERDDVKSHFKYRAWVELPEKHRVRDLLINIISQISGPEIDEEFMTEEELGNTVRDLISRERYLIVMYDVRSEDVWNDLQSVFTNSLNGSRVILAVRKANVLMPVNSWTPGLVKKLLPDSRGRLSENEGTANVVSHPNVSEEQSQRFGAISKYVDEEAGIVGMKDKIRELADLLVTSHKPGFLISVVGARGSGKTILTKAIYDSVAVKQHFQFRVWIFVSNAAEGKTILIDIFKQLTNSNEGEKMQLEELEQRVWNHLARKRYLIVLDDVQNPLVWDSLRGAFPNSFNGSRIVLTLRNANETIERDPQNKNLKLRKLDPKESWLLFQKKFAKDVDHVAEDLKQKILETCDGKPLSIIVLAGLLSNKSYDEWSSVIETTNPRRTKDKRGDFSGQLTSQDTKQRTEPEIAVIKSTDKSESEVKTSEESTSFVSKEEERNRKEMAQKQSFKRTLSKKLLSFNKRQADSKKEDRKTPRHTKDSSGSPLIGVETLVSSSSGMEEVMIDSTEKSDVPVLLSSSSVIYEDEGEDTEAGTDTSAHDESQTDVSGELTEKQILLMGYQDLQPALKSCLLYMGIFNSKEVVPTRRLFHLWQAEGLIGAKDKKTPEMVAEENLEELAVRGMVEVKRRLDGSSKECGIKNSLRDLLFSESDQSSESSHNWFSHSYKEKWTASANKEKSSNVLKTTSMRRFVELNEQSDPPRHACFKALRSYISFNSGYGDTPAYRVEKFLKRTIEGRGFALLTVLDLEGVYKPVLLEAMGKLLQLKYLGLRWTYLDKIPIAVGDLPQLETLDLKGTNLTTLPGSIWNAKKLRHLYMNGIHFDFSARDFPIGGSTINLQTLWGLLIGIRKPPVQWLDGLTKLRKLGLTCHENSIKEILEWISSKLMTLQSLRLRCVNEYSEPSSFELKSLSGCKKLSKLYLLGRLTNPIEGNMFPLGLTSLTLSISYLEKDPMQVLKNLKELKVLRLLAHSYTGENMICESGTFTKLLILKLWNLESLKNWTVHGGALLDLKELEIRSCNNLNQPKGLENLKKLKEVILTHMPEDFATKFTSSVEDNIHVRKVSAEDSIAS